MATTERLYQFPSKASPVPADIIYVGDSADAFIEVQCTIAQIIAAYPNLSGIAGLTLSANTYIYANNSDVLTAGSISALAVSLLADTTIAAMQGTLGYTAIPTASLFAGWDVNVNLSANNFNAGYATTVTAASTTVLTVGSAGQQYFTGSTTQTVTMPVASTLALGQSWLFVNLSSGTVTIQSSGGNTITSVGTDSSTRVTCILASGTTAASWSAQQPVAGSGVVSTGTINDLAYYAANGSTITALATSNSSVLVTSSGGVPSLSTTLPPGIAASGMILTSPKIITSLLDTNGNVWLGVSPIASAVNYLAISNSATGTPLAVAASGSDTNIIISISGKGTGNVQISGTKAADNASAGFVGEYVSSNIPNASAITLMANTATDLTSISLTAGDWDIVGNVYFQPTGIIETLTGWISITSATSPDSSNVAVTLTAAAANGIGFCVPTLRVNVSTTTTVYLSVLSSSTPKVSGTIQARRRR